MATAEYQTEFMRELKSLINKYSMENTSNTPDFILALYLVNCLASFDIATMQRCRWYGEGNNESVGDVLNV